ncbi:hypothetical protein IK112_02410 [Candidatus Saccharibacteria bacterium]|nr:hypothetical protein [Candidatus Saccharibacteria bacterium]
MKTRIERLKIRTINYQDQEVVCSLKIQTPEYDLMSNRLRTFLERDVIEYIPPQLIYDLKEGLEELFTETDPDLLQLLFHRQNIIVVIDCDGLTTSVSRSPMLEHIIELNNSYSLNDIVIDVTNDGRRQQALDLLHAYKTLKAEINNVKQLNLVKKYYQQKSS